MIRSYLALALLLPLTLSIRFTATLQAYEKTCFYEILQSQQKYSIDLTPKSEQIYEVEINNMMQGRWNTIYFKQSKHSFDAISIHKLAAAQSTYSFCIKNTDQSILKIAVNIQSGLELMEFEMLPDKTDSQNLERQLNWLENQKRKLFESLDRMEGLRASSQGLTNLMSNKMIGFAIVGLLSIVAVNFMFYKELKKTFKDRKLI